MSGYATYRDSATAGSTFDAQSFLVNSIINRIATTTLVKVVKVSNAGEVAPVGTVDIIILVNQVDGAQQPTPHGVIHNVPYFRHQGGTDAIILDPKVGDIGIAMFCSRDISIVKRTKSQTNPGSSRKYDFADALYIGGVLNGVPQQYVRFSTDGIDVLSPTRVRLTAPLVEIDASSSMKIVTPIHEVDASAEMIVNTPVIVGNLAITGTLTNNGHAVGSTHQHLNSGGSGLGGMPV